MDFIEEKIEKTILSMSSRADFTDFVELLLDDYEQNHEFWYNQDLRAFLVGLRDYSRGEGGYILPEANSTPTWAAFAEMLSAARAFG